nr:MAG TPA: hypothetical protein [Caudoviricetes sp.]
MAVSTTYLAKVKMSLRVTATTFDTQISDLIEEALLDLTKTADIKTFAFDSADALQSGAIIAYVAYKWFNDSKYFDVYNDMKQKMAISGHYRSVMVNEE